MKRVLIALVTVCMIIGLCACGQKTETKEPAGSSQKPVEQESVAAPVAEPQVELVDGEMIDTGKFKALCPQGFFNVPWTTDATVESDGSISFSIYPYGLQFGYGATSEMDAGMFPRVVINYDDNNLDGEAFIDELIEAYKSLQEDIDVGSIKIGKAEYKTISRKESILDTENEFTDVWMPMTKGFVIVSFPTVFNGQDAFTIDDPNIQSIIASIEID